MDYDSSNSFNLTKDSILVLDYQYLHQNLLILTYLDTEELLGFGVSYKANYSKNLVEKK